jgi:hypothetical protein
VNAAHVMAAAVLCVSAAPPGDARFRLETGDPAGLTRPRGPCGGYSPPVSVNHALIPSDQPMSADGCQRSRTLRKDGALRFETWLWRAARDGGLTPRNTEVDELGSRWDVHGACDACTGAMPNVVITELDDAGEPVLETGRRLLADGGVEGTLRVVQGEVTYDGTVIDGGWAWKRAPIRCWWKVVPIKQRP